MQLLLDHCEFSAITPPSAFIRASGEIPGSFYYGLTIDSCAFKSDANGGLTAIQLDDLVMGAMIISPLVTRPNPTDTPANIIISNSGSEVAIIGGSGGVKVVNNVEEPYPLHVSDASMKSAWLGTADRMRLVRLTAEERDDLKNVAIGDMIYKTSPLPAGVQVMTAGGWVDL